jgi:hypothetical protein
VPSRMSTRNEVAAASVSKTWAAIPGAPGRYRREQTGEDENHSGSQSQTRDERQQKSMGVASDLEDKLIISASPVVK